MRFPSLILAGALAVPGFALAQQAGGERDQQQHGQQQEGQQQPGQQQHGQQPGQQQPGQERAEMFEGEDNYRVEGRVMSVEQDKIMIQREELPQVSLQVPQDAEIRLDGEEATLQQLQPGSEVRASFNVADDQPIAVELEAQAPEEQEQQRGTEQRQQ